MEKEQDKQGKKGKKPSRKRGCLISALLVSALIVYAIWQIGEPGRRAKQVHQAIKPGMSLVNVENLLTGRHYCFFQVKTNEQWQNISREELNGLMAAQHGKASAAMRLQLHFMGTAPGRVSFFVELDHNGNVTNITNPYGWD